jgi:hypothetical protein
MNKKTMTAAELAALETKKAAKKAARKEAIKKKVDLLAKADPKTVTVEQKAVLEMLQDGVTNAIADAFDEMDLSDTVERLEEVTEALAEIDKVLEDADLKNFKAGIDEKLLKVRGMVEKMGKGSDTGNGRKSIADMIEEKSDDIKELSGKQSGSIKIAVKMGRKDAPDFIGLGANTNWAGVADEPNILNNTVLPESLP